MNDNNCENIERRKIIKNCVNMKTKFIARIRTFILIRIEICLLKVFFASKDTEEAVFIKNL